MLFSLAEQQVTNTRKLLALTGTFMPGHTHNQCIQNRGNSISQTVGMVSLGCLFPLGPVALSVNGFVETLLTAAPKRKGPL